MSIEEFDDPFNDKPTRDELSEYWEDQELELPEAIYAINQQGNKFLVVEDNQSMFILISKIKPKTATTKKREIGVFFANRNNCELRGGENLYYYCEQPIYIIISVDSSKMDKITENLWEKYLLTYINIDSNNNLNFDF